MPLDKASYALWDRYERALQYELRLQEARDDFGVFCEMMCPGIDADDPMDTTFTRLPFHNMLINTVERMHRGQLPKVLLSAPPRHGKTFTTTILHAAWFHGRNPDKDLIVATYSKELAEKEFSSDFYQIVSSQRFMQVFPEYALDQDNNSASTRKTIHGGKAFFVGRGSITTGLGGNLILVDDPIKNEREARSDLYRDSVWEWLTKTIFTRRHELGKSPMMITLTRWTADDPIGRISDPSNARYNPLVAEGWEKINIPALADENNDILGRNKGEALWEEKHPAKELLISRETDPVGFSCLYQGNPTPDEGVLFQTEDLVEYSRDDLEEIRSKLRIYVFSDHAYGETKLHDPSCFAPVGIAPNGDAYFMPDLFWDRIGTEKAVEQMIDMIRRHRPMTWFPENGAIYKTLEPFLRKRMQEENVACSFEPVWPKGNRQSKGSGKFERSQAALARCKMGKIKFPGFAPWWQRAKAELLTFPNGSHDDFVDCLSLVGLQIDRIGGYGRSEPTRRVEEGTYEAMFGDDDLITHNQVGGAWTGKAI